MRDGLTDVVRGFEVSTDTTKLLIFPRGTFSHPEYGTMTFDDVFFAEIKRNYDERVLGQTLPFVDVEHNKGAAAGWMDRGLSIEPDGLYALVSWTPLGEELLVTREFAFFSPWWSAFKDPETGTTFANVLRGGALTNIPFLKMLPPIALMEPGDDNAALARARKSGRIFMLSELTIVSPARGDVVNMPALVAALSAHRQETTMAGQDRAKAEYTELVAAEMRAGAPYTAACEMVDREHPGLVDRAFSEPAAAGARGGDPIAEYERRLCEYMRGGFSYSAAREEIYREHPDLAARLAERR